MKGYRHLDIFEREMLDRLLFQQQTLTEIATTMGRGKSTLSREIRRAKMTPGSYRAWSAEMHAQKKRHLSKKPKKIVSNERLKTYIHEHLTRDWSPEQIANRLKMEYPCGKTTWRTA